jgi:hypothetical protein
MYNVNGMVATLVQFNRNDDENIYDDQDTKELDIVVCPYNVDQAIRYGIYTIPEATGYFIVKSKVDVREGDQLIFKDRTFTILKVQDNWLWNKVANISIAVK